MDAMATDPGFQQRIALYITSGSRSTFYHITLAKQTDKSSNVPYDPYFFLHKCAERDIFIEKSSFRWRREREKNSVGCRKEIFYSLPADRKINCLINP